MGRAAVSDAILKTFGVLLDDDLVGLDGQRALGQRYRTDENGFFFRVVEIDAIGLQVDRFLAICAFGARGQGNASMTTANAVTAAR